MGRRTRLVLDIGLLVALLLAFWPGVTGISLHEWLSLAIIVPALVHVIVNWDWVVRVGARLLSSLRTAPEVNLDVDALHFVSTVTVVVSGLVVSQTIAGALGLASAADGVWRAVHSASATATLALLALHAALHASWLLATIRGRVSATTGEVAA